MTDLTDRVDSEAVHVSLTIAASPGTVWKFLSDGPSFASWLGAFAGQKPLAGTSVDPRVGGEIRVAFPGGNAAAGRITAMEPQRRIAFTWGYTQESAGLPPGSSQVEITLTGIPEGTLVRLAHTGLPTEEMRKGHLGGWRHYLSMLSREAAGLQHGEKAERAFAAYFRAWAEPDEAARLQLLSEACEPEVRVRTSFACTDDVAKLSMHIAGSLRHMAGMTLAADGPVEILHGHARIRWRVSAPDGKVAFRGEMFASLSPAGRLDRVVSFQDAPA